MLTWGCDDRLEILSLYNKLHSAGILHVDVEPRHWLRHPHDGRIRLIDFDMAVVGPSEVEKALEIERVKDLLRLH